MSDDLIQSAVLEIVGSNLSTTFITCPADPQKTLAIKLPFLVLVVKSLNDFFSFEVTFFAIQMLISSTVIPTGPNY